MQSFGLRVVADDNSMGYIARVRGADPSNLVPSPSYSGERVRVRGGTGKMLNAEL
jgi:hypothetical protein